MHTNLRGIYRNAARHADGRSLLLGAGLGAGIGAALMYALDPQQGRRRLATARERTADLGRSARAFTSSGVRDLGHRAQGLGQRMSDLVHRSAVDDRVVADRVRAALRRVTPAAHAVEVTSSEGRVCLTGALTGHERERALKAVRAVSGVKDVDDRLYEHGAPDRPQDVAAGTADFGRDAGPDAWDDGPRLLALTGGTGLAAYGLARGRGSIPGLLLGVLGAGLALRAWRNERLSRTLGRATGRRSIGVEKSIHVEASPDRLFALWSDYENFPHFMSLVQEVRRLDDRRSAWVVKGPAGTRLHWTAITEERMPGRVISWCTEAGSPVEHEGSVRFEPEGDGTRVRVRMTYRPPGGVVGHTVASILGRDPAQEMEEDLARMKTFVETGRVPEDAADPSASREASSQPFRASGTPSIPATQPSRSGPDDPGGSRVH